MQGLAIEKRLPDISGVLNSLISKLEKDRKALNSLDKATDPLYCENFALRVFARGDKSDRAGRYDKATAMAFYAASYFIEVSGWGLQQQNNNYQRSGNIM